MAITLGQRFESRMISEHKEIYIYKSLGVIRIRWLKSLAFYSNKSFVYHRSLA